MVDNRLPVDAAILVVAKAPVAGQVKTRLAPPLSLVEAAHLAAAALLDTLGAVACAPVRHRVVALTGDLAAAELAEDVAAALAGFDVVEQRGATFAARLAHAHADTAQRTGVPVLQIGMDTPQLDAELLTRSAETLAGPGVDAVLGPAADGGWWALGLCAADVAAGLTTVRMSTADTGAATLAMLRDRGQRTRLLPELVDVDHPADALYVAGSTGSASRFGRAVDALTDKLAPPQPAQRPDSTGSVRP
ncbi:MAG TPA: DUF2064 domain-containing protein [Aldersonia sp.]